jgi:hypothetical protein
MGLLYMFISKVFEVLDGVARLDLDEILHVKA